jgi:3-oxoacyl-[acyl-carrier protein] reductase
MSDTFLDLDYEDIHLGMEKSFSVTITEELVSKFSEISGDISPLHMDEDFAKESQFGKRLVHGMLLASFISQMVGIHLPGRNGLCVSQETQFPNPCFIGDTVQVVGKVEKKSDVGRILTLDLKIFREPDCPVLVGKIKAMVLAKKKLKNIEKTEGMDLSDKNVLIVGGSGEIGGAIAKTLALHKANVAITYNKNKESAQKLKDEMLAENCILTAYEVDLTAPEGLNSFFQNLSIEDKNFDTLIHCAAGDLEQKSFADSTWEDMQKNLDISIKGFFSITHKLLPIMVEKKSGNIITVLDTQVIGTPSEKNAAYVTAKYALLGLSKALAKEYGPHGIRVNMLSPGLTDTNFVKFIPQRIKDTVAFETPLKRIAYPSDIAKIALFLVSDLSDYLSGVNLPICGGHDMV